VNVGDHCWLLPGHRFGASHRPGSVSFGHRCYVNRDCWFDAGAATITIGAHVVIAAHVSFQAATHQLGGAERRAEKDEAQSIVVEDGCWIGVGAIVMPGVRIAAGCVIGAGAVVVCDTEPNGVYVGMPAKRQSDLPNAARRPAN
jgi:acetyltransferase-like isoleucine patch superfamily enzyme